VHQILGNIAWASKLITLSCFPQIFLSWKALYFYDLFSNLKFQVAYFKDAFPSCVLIFTWALCHNWWVCTDELLWMIVITRYYLASRQKEARGFCWERQAIHKGSTQSQAHCWILSISRHCKYQTTRQPVRRSVTTQALPFAVMNKCFWISDLHIAGEQANAS